MASRTRVPPAKQNITRYCQKKKKKKEKQYERWRVGFTDSDRRYHIPSPASADGSEVEEHDLDNGKKGCDGLSNKAYVEAACAAHLENAINQLDSPCWVEVSNWTIASRNLAGSIPGENEEGLDIIGVVLYYGASGGLQHLATETEKTAQQFHRDKSHLDNQGRYYPFNFDHGLEENGLEESMKKKEAAAATRRYVELQMQSSSITRKTSRLPGCGTVLPHSHSSRRAPQAHRRRGRRASPLKIPARLMTHRN